MSGRRGRCAIGESWLQELLRAQGLLCQALSLKRTAGRPSAAGRVTARLIDTDGCVAPDGQVEFCTTEPRLADGVYELLAALRVTGRSSKGGQRSMARLQGLIPHHVLLRRSRLVAEKESQLPER